MPWRYLVDAAIDNNIAEVKKLLKNGKSIEEKDSDGFTALMCASLLGHEEMVNFLIDRGANVRAQNKNGVTSLHAASWNGNIIICKILLEVNANIHAKIKDGRTAIDLARERNHPEVVDFLSGESIISSH